MPAAVKLPRERASADDVGWMSSRVRSVFSRLPAFGLLVLIVGLSVFLVDLLKRRAQSAELFRVDPGRIELGELPDFVPDRVVDELRALRLVEPRSIFDPTLSDDLKASLARHPWVREVRDMHKIMPNRMSVDVELRAPMAVVDVGAWRLTVDRDGYVLEDHASLAPQGLYRIRGDKRTIPRIPKIGGRFQSEAVEDGLSVVQDLLSLGAHPIFRYVSIETVDVANVGSAKGSEITLELANGTLVEWGSASTGATGPIEFPASHKLDNMLVLNDQHPGLTGLARVHVAAKDAFASR